MPEGARGFVHFQSALRLVACITSVVPPPHVRGSGAGVASGSSQPGDTRPLCPCSLRHRPPGDVHGPGPHAARPAGPPLPGALHARHQRRPGPVAPGAGHVLDGQRLCGEYRFPMTPARSNNPRARPGAKRGEVTEPTAPAPWPVPPRFWKALFWGSRSHGCGDPSRPCGGSWWLLWQL